jgi:DNA-binding response OmpR family regulator
MGGKRTLKTPPVLKWMRPKRVLLVDDSAEFARFAVGRLRTAGFECVDWVPGSKSAWEYLSKHHPDVLLMDIRLKEYDGDGLDLLMALRIANYKGLTAAVSADGSISQLYRALVAGANDYWVKGLYFNPVLEVVDLLSRKVPAGEVKWAPENLARLGYWRTNGVTPAETESITDYSRELGLQKSVAERTGKSYGQLRKTVARVKEKCGVKTLFEFGQLVALCELMGSRPAGFTGSNSALSGP